MLAFTDQCGTIHQNDPVKRPVLLTLCMMEHDISDLTRRIYNIKERIFGPEDPNNPREIKSVNLLNPKSLTTRDKNKKLADEVIQTMLGYNVSVFAAVMHRPDSEIPRERPDILPNRYKYLLERVSYFAYEKNSMALLVYDEDAKDKILWRGINNYLYKHEAGKNLNILEMPLFVKSVITPGVQIADLMAGIVRHYYEKNLNQKEPENIFEEWIKELFSMVSDKCFDYQNERGTTNYGIFLMHKNSY